MEKTLVSILIPVYGVEKFIERCAVSVFEQTYGNVEYIFVDDFTPDNSIDLLKNVIECYPNRKDAIHIIRHNHNKGLAAARNTAVAAAHGEFIWHVDSDDYVEKDAVEKLISKQRENDSDIVFMELHRKGETYSYRINREEFSASQEWTCAFLSRKAFVSIWSALFKRELYINNNVEEEEGVNMGEDYQTLPRLTYHAKRIDVLHEPLYNYVMLNDSSFSNSFSLGKSSQYWRAVDVLYDFFKDKGNEYLNALEIGKAEICLEMLRSCTRSEGNYDAFKTLRKQLSEIDKSAIKSLSLPYKILACIDNYTLMHWYVRCSGWVKRSVLTIKGNRK